MQLIYTPTNFDHSYSTNQQLIKIKTFMSPSIFTYLPIFQLLKQA